nr:hypothetical protein [Tanacetum cinerariifolium]
MSEHVARDAEIARIHAEEELQIMIDGLDRSNETIAKYLFEQESAKRLKTSEEVPEEAKSPDEVPEEKVKEMMQLVPIEEVYVEALQVKHSIIDWKVHTEGHKSYWKITRLVGRSATTVLASGVAEVPTGSGSIPTAGSPAAEVPTGSDVVPIAGLIFATATVTGVMKQ